MRWRARARFGVLERLFCVSLDANHRQYDDGCGFSGISATKAH